MKSRSDRHSLEDLLTLERLARGSGIQHIVDAAARQSVELVRLGPQPATDPLGRQVDELHSERNPWFGGVNPEPIRPHVDEALERVREGGYDLGLLLDGDADRAGAVDEHGVFIHQLQCMGLLMYYMLEHRGERAPVVSTINETAMAFRLGERYGVEVHETPVGFKYVGPRMIETGAMMGGEESGGYGFGMHLPERDGIYADLLLLDLFVRERDAGRWP